MLKTLRKAAFQHFQLASVSQWFSFQGAVHAITKTLAISAFNPTE